MFNRIEKLSFKERMIRLVIVWALLLITAFSLQYFRKIYIVRNIPVYKNVFNEQCDFSILKTGDTINYDGKLQTVDSINFWEYSNKLEIGLK